MDFSLYIGLPKLVAQVAAKTAARERIPAAHVDHGVGSLGGARMPSHACAYFQRGAGLFVPISCQDV